MKSAVIAACIWASALKALALVPERLPRPEFADTEVTTNCPFAFDRFGTRNFQFDLTFAGTASNCVQIAFGRDADTNGVLSAAETGLLFAWDCGTWRLSGVASDSSEVQFACPAATAEEAKALRWDLRLRRRRPVELTLVENGAALFPEFLETPPCWFFDTSWNMFRLTVRGVDAPEEEACVNLNVEGQLFILR